MKHFLANLNKAFESRIRLGVMSLLMVNDTMDFNTLKKTLEVTDGNLATHLATLEKNKFIKVKKGFAGRKPLTTYSATAAGRKAFTEHLTALEELIRNNR